MADYGKAPSAPRPQWAYWDNRASLDTDDEREQRYQGYLEHSAPYFEKVAANGDEPWFSSEAERRQMFYRRHVRPEPPEGMNPPKSIRDYQRNDDVRISSESDHRRVDQIAA